jgi:hypothetical protein
MDDLQEMRCQTVTSHDTDCVVVAPGQAAWIAEASDDALLARAAKAAGLSMTPDGCVWCDDQAEMMPWRPLDDDGDALRLMGRLMLVLNVSSGSAHCWKWNPGSVETWRIGASNPEKMAAIRRAIVREAASLAGTTT